MDNIDMERNQNNQIIQEKLTDNGTSPKDDFQPQIVKKMIEDEIPKKFPCELCNKSFKQHSQLKTHIKGVHQNDKPFSCELCDTKCLFESALKIHIKFKHDNVTQ